MITDAEFQAIIQDTSKRIENDIEWRDDEDHSLAQEFRVPVMTDNEDQLHLNGWCNPFSGKLSFTLIREGTGRIYALDLGGRHKNPDGTRISHTHKHYWTDDAKDKRAYIPDDITADIHQPTEVWEQFCKEANIRHDGSFTAPKLPRRQKDLI